MKFRPFVVSITHQFVSIKVSALESIRGRIFHAIVDDAVRIIAKNVKTSILKFISRVGSHFFQFLLKIFVFFENGLIQVKILNFHKQFREFG